MIRQLFTLVLGRVNAADLWVLHAFNSLSGNPLLDRPVDLICTSNLIKGAVPLAIYWYFWFDGSRRLQDSRSVLLKGVLAALLAVLVARLIAHWLPVRVRPFADPASGFRPLFGAPPSSGNFEDWSAFPSDTAAFEFALAWSLLRISRISGWFLLFFGGIFACLTRIYLGLHYPSDIVVGAIIGVGVAAQIQRREFAALSRSRLLRGYYAHPLFYGITFLVTYEFAQVFDDLRALRKFIIDNVLNAPQADRTVTLVGLGLAFSGTAVVIVAALAWAARSSANIRAPENVERHGAQTAVSGGRDVPPLSRAGC